MNQAISKENKSRNILFYRPYPDLDGTFTLVLRLCNYLQTLGDKGYLIFSAKHRDCKILKDISVHTTVLFFEELPGMGSNLPRIDIIHAFAHTDSIFDIFHNLKKKYFPGAKVVFGIYHPRALIQESILGQTADTRFLKKFISKIPSKNIAYMNEAVRQSHERYFRMNLQNSPIIPIPVEVPTLCPLNKNKAGLIVSIGRLVEFKKYIFGVINAVEELLREGYSLEYHIYGDGMLKKELEHYITSRDLNNNIKLCGTVEYAQVKKIIQQAYLFIGMGTSVIESSALGVPTLLAIESKTASTYGWFFNTKGFEVGEVVENKEEYDYSDFIRDIITATPEAYEKMRYASWQRALDFSNLKIMKEYNRFYDEAEDYSPQIGKLNRVLLKLYRQPLKIPGFIKKGFEHN